MCQGHFRLLPPPRALVLLCALVFAVVICCIPWILSTLPHFHVQALTGEANLCPPG